MVNNYYYNVIVVLKHRLSHRELGNFCRLLPEEQILARRKSHENRNSQSIISNQSIRNRSSFPQAIGIRGKTPQSRFLPSRGSQRSSMLFRCQIPYRIWTLKKTSPFLLVLLDSQPSECYQVCREDKISLHHRVRGVRIVWPQPTLSITLLLTPGRRVQKTWEPVSTGFIFAGIKLIQRSPDMWRIGSRPK